MKADSFYVSRRTRLRCGGFPVQLCSRCSLERSIENRSALAGVEADTGICSGPMIIKHTLLEGSIATCGSRMMMRLLAIEAWAQLWIDARMRSRRRREPANSAAVNGASTLYGFFGCETKLIVSSTSPSTAPPTINVFICQLFPLQHTSSHPFHVPTQLLQHGARP